MKFFTKYVAKQFGNPSGFGGMLATFIMNRLNRKQYKATINNAKIQSTDVLLDIGFGNGYLIKKLLKQKPELICGIEISQDMLNKVSRKNQAPLSSGKLDLQLANLKKLPYGDNRFDKICTVNTLYFWDDTDGCFSEIKRTLKPGGKFLNTIYTKEWLDKLSYTRYGFSKYTIDEIVTMTEKSGLKVIRIFEIQQKTSFCIIAERTSDSKIE